MYVVVLAFSGSRVLLPNAVGIREDEDTVSIHFVDAEDKVLATFQRPDITVHGFEEDLPPPNEGVG